MKKQLLLIFQGIIFLGIFSVAGAQDWQWTGHATGTSNLEDITGMDIDASGNIFVTGTFTTGSTLSGTSLTTVGIEDIFIAKYNSSGVLQWVRTGGTTDKDLSRTLAVDGSGNVYVTGLFRGNVTFDSTALDAKDSQTLVTGGKRDVFIAKYNTSGEMVFLKHAAWGAENDVPEGLALDSDDNIYISGTFKSNTFGFDSDTLTREWGALNGFIAKFNSDGDFQWAKHTIHNI